MNQLWNKDFLSIVGDLVSDPKVKEMKKYIQHGKKSTYDHCMSVARMSYRIGRIFPMGLNQREMLRGAVLHDYFLYDWHSYTGPLHGFHHANTALKNAKRDFKLTEREQNIIYSHMWPLTLRAIPKHKEAVIVCVADKIVSTKETLFDR